MATLVHSMFLFRPELEYSQSAPLFLGLLLTQLPVESCFWVWLHLLTDYHFDGLFRTKGMPSSQPDLHDNHPGMPLVIDMITLLSTTLEERLPDVALVLSEVLYS